MSDDRHGSMIRAACIAGYNEFGSGQRAEGLNSASTQELRSMVAEIAAADDLLSHRLGRDRCQNTLLGIHKAPAATPASPSHKHC